MKKKILISKNSDKKDSIIEEQARTIQDLKTKRLKIIKEVFYYISVIGIFVLHKKKIYRFLNKFKNPIKIICSLVALLAALITIFSFLYK